MRWPWSRLFTNCWQGLIRLTGRLHERQGFLDNGAQMQITRFWDSPLGVYNAETVILGGNGSLVFMRGDNAWYPVTPGWTLKEGG